MDNTFFYYRAGSNWNGISAKGKASNTYILDKIIDLTLKNLVPKREK